MVSVPTCAVTLTSLESYLRKTQTTPKDPRNRSATTAGCSETCFNYSCIADTKFTNLVCLLDLHYGRRLCSPGYSRVLVNVTKRAYWKSVLFLS